MVAVVGAGGARGTKRDEKSIKEEVVTCMWENNGKDKTYKVKREYVFIHTVYEKVVNE